MGITTCNGQNLYFETHGQGEDLILIAGFTADHRVWKWVLPTLSQQLRVTIFDNRGAGQSDAPDKPYSTTDMAADTVALMDALSIDQAHVFGHSMGGNILLQMLLHWPKRIHRAIICATGVLPSASKQLHYRVNQALIDAGFSEDIIFSSILSFLMGDDFLSDPNNIDNFIDFLKNNPNPQKPWGKSRQEEALKKNHISKDELMGISNDVLCISCDDDKLNPIKQARYLSETMPHATLATINNCGHIPQIEQSQALCQLIINFLSQLVVYHDIH